MERLSDRELNLVQKALNDWRNEDLSFILHRRARKNSPYIFSIWVLPHGLRNYVTVPKADDRVLFWSLTKIYVDNGRTKGAVVLPPIALKYDDLTNSYREMFSIIRQEAERERKIAKLEDLLQYAENRTNDIRLLLEECKKIRERAMVRVAELGPKKITVGDFA